LMFQVVIFRGISESSPPGWSIKRCRLMKL
jgi:hypothetical protein